MAPHSLSSHLSILILACLSFSPIAHAFRDNDTDLYHFVTRPDLKPPKWEIKVHDEEGLAPGYWFLAPFRSPHDGEDGDGWVGPTIYDGSGQLIWSGATEFHNNDITDFRINVRDGEQLITLLDKDENAGYILDTNFTTRKKLKEVTNDAGQVDLHEFLFVDNGTEALAITTKVGHAEPACVKEHGHGGQCPGVHYDGFHALDTTTWEEKFAFASEDVIPLEETTAGGWDYLHANSVDKTTEGNYLWNCRHTDTIYYIDGKDGKIIWRLGGQKNDFEMDDDVKFTRQHNIRFRGMDGHKMWISILDNAKGQDVKEPSREMSRGLRLLLDTKKMTAEIDLEIPHPDGEGNYAHRRGNYQVLPNDNIFMGWSEQATQSEHAPDGRLLMEATLATKWLGSYRSYKFDFVGKPVDPPEAVAQATTIGNTTESVVHVSWNGATEVAFWNVYAAGGPKGDGERTFITEAERNGFETKIVFPSFAPHVVVEAVDKDMVILGTTAVTQTTLAADADFAVIAASLCADREGRTADDDDEYDYQLGALIAVAVIGYVCLGALALAQGRGLPATRRFASWVGLGGRRYRDEPQELDERNSDEEGRGQSDSLLKNSEKDW